MNKFKIVFIYVNMGIDKWSTEEEFRDLNANIDEFISRRIQKLKKENIKYPYLTAVGNIDNELKDNIINSLENSNYPFKPIGNIENRIDYKNYLDRTDLYNVEKKYINSPKNIIDYSKNRKKST